MKTKKKNKESPYKKVDRIRVSIWGQYVGALALDENLGFYVFAYHPEFARSGIELSPLHMPLNDKEKLYAFTDLPEETFKRLPALLADILPDEFGNALIDKYMAEKGLPRASITPLDRLAYMGNRAMGAIEFKPIRGPKKIKPTIIEMSELVTAARKAVKGHFEGDLETEAALRTMIEVGTSANGARAKAVIGWNKKTGEIRSGQTALPDGFEYWLLKFDGMGKDLELGSSEEYGRIEYAYSLMAKQAGIQIAESYLLEENGRAHFMTKRFDREKDGTKHHLQSLCAMNHLDFKKRSTNNYEQLFMTMLQINLPRQDLVEAFRRMVFNIMACNCDDHTKNVSFLLRKGEGWRLAPAYDLTFAYNPKGKWTFQHLMSVNGKFKNISQSDCLALADRFGLGEAPSIIDQVKKAVKDWKKYAKEAGINSQETNRIHAFFQ